MTQTLYQVLIPHPKRNRVLVLVDEHNGAPHLPRYVMDESESWQSTETVNRLVFENLALPVTVLRCLIDGYDAAANTSIKLYAMENHSAAWNPPPNATWIGRSDPMMATLSPQEREWIEGWFEWVIGERGIKSVPWYRFGWFDSAMDWIRGELDRLGYTRVSDIQVEQIRVWERSTVIRVQTSRDRMYFKAVPEIFRYEPIITQWLAEGYPKQFPRLVTSDQSRGWMLLHDFGVMTLDRTHEPAQAIEALRQFGRLQVSLTKEIDNILELGCPDRRLNIIGDEIDGLLEDTDAMLFGDEYGLTRGEIEYLRSSTPRLRRLISGLEDCGIPYSLEHGDFYLGQIALTNNSFVFFDWSDCSLSHPFFSLCSVLDFIENTHTRTMGDNLAKLMNAYLEAWLPFGTRDRLLQALDLARPLAALHCALLYHRFILPRMEVKWEMERMLPMYLKKVIFHMRRT